MSTESQWSFLVGRTDTRYTLTRDVRETGERKEGSSLSDTSPQTDVQVALETSTGRVALPRQTPVTRCPRGSRPVVPLLTCRRPDGLFLPLVRVLSVREDPVLAPVFVVLIPEVRVQV